MPKIDLASLSGMVQQYISRKYAAALIDRTKVAELKAYIAQYLYDTVLRWTAIPKRRLPKDCIRKWRSIRY